MVLLEYAKNKTFETKTRGVGLELIGDIFMDGLAFQGDRVTLCSYFSLQLLYTVVGTKTHREESTSGNSTLTYSTLIYPYPTPRV